MLLRADAFESVLPDTLAHFFASSTIWPDYGLTAGVKAEIEADFKVELGPSQLRLLNTSRRWHVIAFTAFCLRSSLRCRCCPRSGRGCALCRCA